MKSSRGLEFFPFQHEHIFPDYVLSELSALHVFRYAHIFIGVLHAVILLITYILYADYIAFCCTTYKRKIIIINVA